MKKVLFWSPNDTNGWASNLYIAPMVIDGVQYLTNEHFFQSKKFEGTQHEMMIAQLPTPEDACIEGVRDNLPLRHDWEDVKESIMLKGLRAKFKQNPIIMKELLETGNYEIIENSPYDYYWGIGTKGTGKNRLGVLLMQVRDEFKMHIDTKEGM